MRDVDLLGLQPHELTESEALELLDNFRAVESLAFERGDASLDDIELDYSPESVCAYLGKAVERMRFREGKAGADSTLDATGAVWLGRAAFYFGESLVRGSNHLHWGIGSQDTPFQNMPVVKGFRHELEASVVSIVKNLAISINLDREPVGIIRRAIETWRDFENE